MLELSLSGVDVCKRKSVPLSYLLARMNLLASTDLYSVFQTRYTGLRLYHVAIQHKWYILLRQFHENVSSQIAVNDNGTFCPLAMIRKAFLAAHAI